MIVSEIIIEAEEKLCQLMGNYKLFHQITMKFRLTGNCNQFPQILVANVHIIL
jgi:hypothetical protein